MTNRAPRILHLPQGVTLKQIQSAEELLEEKLTEAAGQKINSVAVPTYDYLPDCYVVGYADCSAGGAKGATLYSRWPRKCDLRCWSCTLTFPNMPFFIPTRMEKTTVRVVDEAGVKCSKPATSFRRLGVTCSANCAVTYIENNLRGDLAAQAKENIVHLYYAMFNARVVHIQPAPRHTELQAYGGPMTDVEFWKRLRELDPQHSIPAYDTMLMKIVTADVPLDAWAIPGLNANSGADQIGRAGSYGIPPSQAGEIEGKEAAGVGGAGSGTKVAAPELLLPTTNAAAAGMSAIELLLAEG